MKMAESIDFTALLQKAGELYQIEQKSVEEITSTLKFLTKVEVESVTVNREEYAQIAEKADRFGEKWTVAETQSLLQAAKRGDSLASIASSHRRTVNGILAHLHEEVEKMTHRHSVDYIVREFHYVNPHRLSTTSSSSSSSSSCAKRKCEWTESEVVKLMGHVRQPYSTLAKIAQKWKCNESSITARLTKEAREMLKRGATPAYVSATLKFVPVHVLDTQDAKKTKNSTNHKVIQDFEKFLDQKGAMSADMKSHFEEFYDLLEFSDL